MATAQYLANIQTMILEKDLRLASGRVIPKGTTILLSPATRSEVVMHQGESLDQVISDVKLSVENVATQLSNKADASTVFTKGDVIPVENGGTGSTQILGTKGLLQKIFSDNRRDTTFDQEFLPLVGPNGYSRSGLVTIPTARTLFTKDVTSRLENHEANLSSGLAQMLSVANRLAQLEAWAVERGYELPPDPASYYLDEFYNLFTSNLS